jgi:hypothetical protein
MVQHRKICTTLLFYSSRLLRLKMADETEEKSPKPEDDQDSLLWEEELRVRQQVSDSRISGNFLGAFFVNTYAAMHIFVVYLICLESLLSITLCVIMTVCECHITFFGSLRGCLGGRNNPP